MAFKMRSPLHNKSPYKLDLQSAFESDDDKADKKEKEVEDETGEMVEDEGESNAEKYQKMMDESESGYSDNPFLRGRIDVARNKAQEARLKGRLDRRLERQEERAKRSNLRNYGNVEGVKQQDQQRLDNIQKEFDDTKENLTLNTPTLDVGSFVENKFQKPKLSLMSMEDDSPMEMKPNRAGRPMNSNMLMTSPIIKTGKHSAKDAVAKLRMRKIAQSE